MRRNWEKLGRSAIPVAHLSGKKPEVLVEYDGPQLVLHRANLAIHLGLLADVDERAQRWLLAPMSRLELEALALGGLPMREVFSRKATLEVVDFKGSTALPLSWTIAIDEVPMGVLPARGAPLPSFARSHLRKLLKIKLVHQTGLRLRFAGLPVHESHIELSALGRISQAFQRLMTLIGESLGIHAIADRGGVPSTELLAGPTSKGSFAVSIKAADPDVFAKILGRYQGLIQAAHENPERLLDEVKPSSALGKGLAAYLVTLEDLKAETFVESPGAQVFVSHTAVGRIRSAMKLPRKPREQVEPLENQLEPTEHRGYFDHFGTDDASFVFYDLDSSEELRGKVSPALTDRIRSQGKQEASVGRITRYRATIEHRDGGHYLLGFEEIGQLKLEY